MNDKQALINVLNRLTAPIEKHTIQFFNNSNPANPDNKPTSRGSGVLLKHNTNHYIATAAHVIENSEDNHFGVYTQTKDFFELGTSCMCKEANDPDKTSLDIAVWYIEPEIADDIAPRDWWYDVENCLINHSESSEERYFIFGFPAKKIELCEDTKAIVQYPFKFHTRGYSTSRHAGKAHFNPKYNLLLEFHKKKIEDIKTGMRQTAPDPYGISGCGLWFLDEGEYRLVGIMTEWKNPTEGIPAFMATKIDSVVNAIAFLESKLESKM